MLKWILIMLGIIAVIALIVGFVIAGKIYSGALGSGVIVTFGNLQRKGKDAPVVDYVKAAVTKIEGEGVLWQMVSYDGLNLKAWSLFHEEPDNHQYIQLHHGYDNHRFQDIANQAVIFYNKGYNVLVPIARGHGISEGSYIGMGWRERKDVIGWTGKIKEKDPLAQVILYGISMGGATVMMASGEELDPCVKGVIEDCGYTSVWDEFVHQFKNVLKFPKFPLLYFGDLICVIMAGYEFKKSSAIKQLAKCKLPVLLIHGDKDNFVPFSMLDKLYAACGSEDKTKLVIENAQHAEAFQVNPQKYWNAVWDFVNRAFSLKK